MGPQQGRGKRCGIKPILTSDQIESRSICQLVARMRSDLMASRTLVFGFRAPGSAANAGAVQNIAATKKPRNKLIPSSA
jgi:hypothetical protein